MNRFVRTIHWLCRKPRTRGFGVQSPFAYHFVTKLVHEKLPYYAYEDLLIKYPTDNPTEIKLRQLWLRLSNYAQPQRACVCTEHADVYADYLRAGCEKVNIVGEEYILGDVSLESLDIFLVSIKADWRQMFDNFVIRAKPTAILVVMNIHSSRTAYTVWKEMILDKRTGVTFDLWDCGIIFFDKKLYKCNYKINL